METMAKFLITVEMGASTQVYLASGSDITSSMVGKFFDNGKVEKVNQFATDDEKAKELWAISEKLSGVEFNL